MDDALIQPLRAAREQAYDRARPDAVTRIHERGRLTARERIGAVIDPGSFVETGVLAGAEDEAAGGLVAGLATVFGASVSICSYDYSVWGGTQTGINHSKIDRIMDLAIRYRWPFVCFADGGGARAQGLRSGAFGGQAMTHEVGTFDGMALLSGLVPTVAVVSGRSFAGNASIAGMSDVVFATRGSAIGIGGPPLVEAALGLTLTPEELGPSEMHEETGGIDLLIDSDEQGAELTRRYLEYFLVERTVSVESSTHGSIASLVPDDRRRAYDMRRVVQALVDEGSVFELRPKWGTAAITALGAPGRPVGGRDRQPTAVADRRGDRLERGRQARQVHPPRRRVRPADRVADGQPGVHARAAGRTRRHRPAPCPAAAGPGPSDGAAVPRPRAQGVRAGPDGDGWPVPTDGPATRVADGGGRRHGAGGRRSADPAQGAPSGRRGGRRSERAWSDATSSPRRCGRAAWRSTRRAATPTTR